VTVGPRETGALERLAVTSECNEALDAARAALTTARRLALVAESALVNGDLRAPGQLSGVSTPPR